MRYFEIRIVLLFCCILFIQSVGAQNDERSISVGFSLPEIALVDVEYIGNGTLEFELLPSAETGEAPVVQQKNIEELWINYSSAKGKLSQNRSIVAQITNGSLPQGLALYIQASAYRGSGDGKHGISAGKVLVGDQPRAIVTNIGSAFTGNGVGSGHSLNFSVDIDQMEIVTAINPTDFTILYTLTDN